MSYQRLLYHPVSLWTAQLTLLLPASLVIWNLLWENLGISLGRTLVLAILLLIQGIIWAASICIRHYRINPGNRRIWLRALAIPVSVHCVIFILAMLASSKASIPYIYLVTGPLLASGYMWMLVRQASKWQPKAPVPIPRRPWQWQSLPVRMLALVNGARLPLPQPDDRQTVLTLVIASIIALLATVAVGHGLATNNLVVVSKRGYFHVSGYELIPWAGVYICLTLLCLSIVMGHRDKRPNAHFYKRFQNVMARLMGILLAAGVFHAFWILIALIVSRQASS